ncbi:hypothetical protein [Stutzerimonas xanthomarina]|nr:hypothetical protein [Stutzerimonas xanthomarina]
MHTLAVQCAAYAAVSPIGSHARMIVTRTADIYDEPFSMTVHFRLMTPR